MSLQNKVVVITGGARGMGRSYVQAFLDKGAKVAALDISWKPSGLSTDTDESFSRELDGRPDALRITGDITNEAQVADALAQTVKKFGTVDVLINNAVLLPSSQFPPTGDVKVLDTKESDWEKAFKVNLFGTLKMIRAFIQPMIKQNRGSVISVGSGGCITRPDPDGFSWAVRRPFSREQPYMATKSAIVTMSCYLADEVKEHNIAVNVINPTGTRTTGYDEKVKERQKRTGEAATRVARPEHVVPLALFLADQEGKTGVTGKAIDAMPWNEKNGFGGWDAWNDVNPA